MKHYRDDDSALQDPRELAQFLSVVRSEGACRYLEIGARHGGCLWRVARTMPVGSTVVAVDYAHKTARTLLPLCVQELRSIGYDAHLILGDSVEPETVAKVTELAPFDLCLIDATHSEEFVERDWLNYGPLARVVAFHDIDNHNCDVPAFWDRLKSSYPRRETIDMKTGNGLGLVWRQ